MIEFRESKVAEMDRRHHHHRRRRRATDDARPICNETNATFDEDTKFIANRINVLKIFHGSNISRVRESLERLPIKLTLENVGIFALSLASIMPRTFTHLLVYPIFRLVFGTLYPAYASYKAVRTKNVKEYVKWMMYWIVFALFTCAETFTDVFLSFWFPFYYEIKIILVLWLLSPATKGSSILYRRFVHPALSRREAEIDEALARATEQGYTAVLHLGSRGVNYATTVLMQTAIKNFNNVVPSASSIVPTSQSDSAISSLANPCRTSNTETTNDSPDSPRTPARRRTRSDSTPTSLIDYDSTPSPGSLKRDINDPSTDEDDNDNDARVLFKDDGNEFEIENNVKLISLKKTKNIISPVERVVQTRAKTRQKKDKKHKPSLQTTVEPEFSDEIDLE